jgi:hypothetical protein
MTCAGPSSSTILPTELVAPSYAGRPSRGASEEVPYLRPNSIKVGVGFIEETPYEFKSFLRIIGISRFVKRLTSED